MSSTSRRQIRLTTKSKNVMKRIFPLNRNDEQPKHARKSHPYDIPLSAHALFGSDVPVAHSLILYRLPPSWNSGHDVATNPRFSLRVSEWFGRSARDPILWDASIMSILEHINRLGTGCAYWVVELIISAVCNIVSNSESNHQPNFTLLLFLGRRNVCKGFDMMTNDTATWCLSAKGSNYR